MLDDRHVTDFSLEELAAARGLVELQEGIGSPFRLEPRKNQGARYKQRRQSDENEATDKDAP
jgi:hypothetical protein